MRHLILLLAATALAAADVAERHLATIADWAQRYPAQAVLAELEPDPQVRAALQGWQDVLRTAPTPADVAAAEVVTIRIGHANGLEGWVHRRMGVADAAVWEDPIGQACVAWHRELYQRRCAEIAGIVPVPDEPFGAEWRKSENRGERHADLTLARAIQIGIARSSLPLAAESSERVAQLVAAAREALIRAEAGEQVPAAVSSYALSQAWQAWTDYQERMDSWGERLPGWRAAYTQAAAALLAPRLALGPAAKDEQAERDTARWQQLLDAHRMHAQYLESIDAYDQEFADLPNRELLRQDCTQAIADLAASDQAWLQAELAGDREHRRALQREMAERSNALAIASGAYALKGRCATRLAAHPTATPARVAAVEAALARAIEAAERDHKARLAPTLATLDREHLDEEKAIAEAEFRELNRRAAKAADTVLEVLNE